MPRRTPARSRRSSRLRLLTTTTTAIATAVAMAGSLSAATAAAAVVPAASVAPALTPTRIIGASTPVTPGHRMYFSSDVTAPSDATGHLTVSWYDSNGIFLSWSGGEAQAMMPSSWQTLSATLDVPSNAVTGQSVVNVLNARVGGPIHTTRQRVSDLTVPTTTVSLDPATDPNLERTPTLEPPIRPLVNNVTQPAIIAYGSARYVVPFAHEGALVIAGRDNYNAPEMKQVSAAGGTVLMYLDAVIDNSYGRYHQMLINSSECGAAVPRWPGNVQANNWGYLNDFRPGSTLQNKLECVLEKIVAENPHIGGFFADDLGSRSWFPNFSWSSFGAQNQLDYRDGAIEISKTFRKVSDRHGLILMVNGTWSGGALSSSGGGYPDASKNGNALADGTMAEHHPLDSYWGNAYPCASQWATQSAVTKGKAFNFAVTNTDAERAAFARTGCYAFAATQQSYDDPASVWGPFSRTGLPTLVRRLPER